MFGLERCLPDNITHTHLRKAECRDMTAALESGEKQGE